MKIKSKDNWIVDHVVHLSKLVKCILRARRAGLLRLSKAETPMRLECLSGKCGLCCAVLGGQVVVKPSEAPFLPRQHLEKQGSAIVIEGNHGACALLKDNACSCYAHRPRGCHEYPWYNVNGNLYYDRGCPGIKFDYDERPNPSELTQIMEYFTTFSPIRSFICVVLRKW
jgi:Fe-S-cluster containining protein